MDEPLTIDEHLAAYRSGASTPAAAIQRVYARIAAHADPAMFITLRPMQDVVGEAQGLALREQTALPLFGIPVAVKDNIDVAGLPTTAGCPAFAYTAKQDASAVARLRAAGALIVGKTNLDQFAAGLVGVRSPYGVPRNALNRELVPGGSSSGSAVAVAAGIVPVALGTDTAGSGRVPAGLNNIVGLKPTLGAVSIRGVVPACRSLDCVSVFAHTVADAYAVLDVLAGFDEEEAFSRPVRIGRPGPLPPVLRIGVPDAASRRFGNDPLSAAAFDAAVVDAASLGGEVRPLDFSVLFAAAGLLYDGPWVAERYQAIRSFIEESPEALHPTTRGIIAGARAYSAADAFSGFHRLAELRCAAASIWHDIDVLMVPTFPRPPLLAELAADPIGPNSELGTYTNFVNLLDFAALAVPGRMRRDGMPAGITLIAPGGQDARLAALGAELHVAAEVTLGATGRAIKASRTRPCGASDGEIELVVVGSHLSGLALNHELTALGARLLRGAFTKPDYRLFALAGGPPHRPGLLRVADARGHVIEAEVWALAPEAFAAFVAGIPAPLTIGTIRLGDGTDPKGFLVEAEATRNARDISEFGGWRSFVGAKAP